MFTEKLELTLKLIIENQSVVVPCGNIKNFSLDLQPYGFHAQADFWISSEQNEDKLFPLFCGSKSIQVQMSLASAYPAVTPAPIPWNLQGIVTHKTLLRETAIRSLQDVPVQMRHYQITFADPARVLWSKHFPSQLYVDKSLKDLIEDQKSPAVTLTSSWDLLTQRHPILALGLGCEDNQASFYDFIAWLVTENHGVWTYDYSRSQYSLLDKKTTQGQALELPRLDTAGLSISFPEPSRHQVTLLNGNADQPKTKDLPNSNAFQGIKKQLLFCSPLTSEINKRATRLQAQQEPSKPFLSLTLNRLPSVDFLPNTLLSFRHPSWTKSVVQSKQEYRIRSITFQAEAEEQDPSQKDLQETAGYVISMESLLEEKDEAHPCLPSYTAPTFPFYVEGHIVSEEGSEDAESYQIYQDTTTSQDQYQVAIPLWNKQKVVIPFEPLFLPGQFYFPAYKGERVLVALTLYSARLKRFLDWRDNARLPMEGQGNHLLVGFNDETYTSLKHCYEEQKPVLHVQRWSAHDTQRIELKEGSLILETTESKE